MSSLFVPVLPMCGYVRVTIWRQYDGSVKISWYPVIAVLKTTSPMVLPSAPTEDPRNMVPSCSARTAGVLKNDPFQIHKSGRTVPPACNFADRQSFRHSLLKQHWSRQTVWTIISEFLLRRAAHRAFGNVQDSGVSATWRRATHHRQIPVAISHCVET